MTSISKMASGGKENDYSRCSVCSDYDRDTPARHYCVECEVYFCSECVKTHTTLKILKTHRVNDVDYKHADYPDSVSLDGVRGSDAVSGQSFRCTLHGKLIDTFCKDHDEVCCRTCAVVKHRSCSTVSIAVASKDYKTSEEIKTYKDKLTENLAQCKQENEKRKNNRESIDREKLELIENVDRHEEKTITRIKELAEVSRQEIQSKHREETTDLDNCIGTLDVVIATNTEYLNKLDNSADEELFTFAKNCKTVIQDGELLIQTITKDWTEKHLLFHFDQTLETCVDEMKSFGHLDVDMNRCDVKAYVATFDSNVNLKQDNDKNSYIFDMCLFDHNTILVTDYNNNKLKRLNSDLQFKDEILLKGTPTAVCKTGTHEAAVRFCSNVVQFVSMGQTMQLTSSFTLNNNGRGLACDAETGEIFACENNKISVYSKSGTKLRTYDNDINGEKMFSECRQVVLCDNKQDIYVTDRDKGLIVLDAKNGTLKMKVAVPGGSTCPLCLLPGGICLVGGTSSDVIVQIDREGKTIGNIINSKDGWAYTYCAVYDHEHRRLIVGGFPLNISVYTLSAK